METMTVLCAGQCGTHLRAPDDGRIYLCRRCWTALFTVVFDLVRRGNEVFTATQPKAEWLN